MLLLQFIKTENDVNENEDYYDYPPLLTPHVEVQIHETEGEEIILEGSSNGELQLLSFSANRFINSCCPVILKLSRIKKLSLQCFTSHHKSVN